MLKPVKARLFLSGDHEFQILDLLQLSRKEREVRLHCLNSVRRFSEWKKTHDRHAKGRAMSYSAIEGEILKRQARDAVYMYRMVKKDRMAVFRRYLEKLPPRQICGAAQ